MFDKDYLVTQSAKSVIYQVHSFTLSILRIDLLTKFRHLITLGAMVENKGSEDMTDEYEVNFC